MVAGQYEVYFRHWHEPIRRWAPTLWEACQVAAQLEQLRFGETAIITTPAGERLNHKDGAVRPQPPRPPGRVLPRPPGPARLAARLGRFLRLRACQKDHVLRTTSVFCDGSLEKQHDPRSREGIDRPRKSAEHPTMKPVAFYANAYLNNSDSGDNVFDPYAGSGTAFVAAEQLDRRCYGLEISPAYCDVIVERWQKLTEKKAKRNRKGRK